MNRRHHLTTVLYMFSWHPRSKEEKEANTSVRATLGAAQRLLYRSRERMNGFPGVHLVSEMSKKLNELSASLM